MLGVKPGQADSLLGSFSPNHFACLDLPSEAKISSAQEGHLTRWLCLQGRCSQTPRQSPLATRATGCPSLKPSWPAPRPHATPRPGVMVPYLPLPRCPRGQCPGRGSAAPRCGRHGSPSPSRAHTPSRLRWRSQHFSPASTGAELPAAGLLMLAGYLSTRCKDRSTQTPALALVSICTVDGASAVSSLAALK